MGSRTSSLDKGLRSCHYQYVQFIRHFSVDCEVLKMKANSLEEELKTPDITPERREILDEAVRKFYEVCQFLERNKIGTFRVMTEEGSAIWAPHRKE